MTPYSEVVLWHWKIGSTSCLSWQTRSLYLHNSSGWKHPFPIPFFFSVKLHVSRDFTCPNLIQICWVNRCAAEIPMKLEFVIDVVIKSLFSSFFFPLRSALRHRPGSFLPPSVELWAQLSSLQFGSQLQPAPLLVLHHQLHFHVSAGEPPIHPGQPCPCPSSTGPCSTPPKRISGEKASAPPHPRSHHPSAGFRLWAGTWAGPQAGNRQPVHVALTCWFKHLHHF